MRLICPNCDAQYEVGTDMIPPEGREVQCSNCAHTWFENQGDSDARAAERQTPPPERVVSRPVAEPAPAAVTPTPSRAVKTTMIDTTQKDDVDAVLDAALSDVSVTTAPPTDTASASLAARIEQERATNTPEPEPKGEVAQDAPASPRKSTVTPGIADILKEEAALETQRRASPAADPLESQPNLNIDAQPPVESNDAIAEQARERMARLKIGAQEKADKRAALAAERAAARGDLLPDVEEINSTLRRQEKTKEAEAKGDTGTKSRFGRGFITALILALVLLLLYIFAPQIGRLITPLSGLLSGYVSAIDTIRLALDNGLQALLPG